MTKHPIRAAFIWIVIAIALFNIYPTIGWMTLTPEARQTRIETWQSEDDERAREKTGYFKNLSYNMKRWAQFDQSRVGQNVQHVVRGFARGFGIAAREERLCEKGPGRCGLVQVLGGSQQWPKRGTCTTGTKESRAQQVARVCVIGRCSERVVDVAELLVQAPEVFCGLHVVGHEFDDLLKREDRGAVVTRLRCGVAELLVRLRVVR